MPVNDNCDTKDKSERVEKQYITKKSSCHLVFCIQITIQKSKEYKEDKCRTERYSLCHKEQCKQSPH